MTIILSIIETAGVSLIMPFISVASNPTMLDSGIYKKIYDFFGFFDKKTFIIALGIGIIVFYVFRAIYCIVHVYSINRFSQALFKFFSKSLLNTFLSLPYKTYAKKNSGEMMHIITGSSSNVSILVLNLLQLGSEVFTVLLVYVLILAVNWKMTLIITVVLLIIVVCFFYILVSKSKALGVKMTDAGLKWSRTLRETFGNFKFVKLKGNESDIISKFSSSLDTYSRANIVNGTLGVAPKSFLESIGFSLLIAAVLAVLIIYGDASQVIPIISLYAIALYRILPSVHRMLGNVNAIAYHQRSLDIVDENIHQSVEKEGTASLDFNSRIRLENISFGYTGGNNVLNSISFEIQKGEKIAITGESGGGKSTLADLIIGIHKPTSGALYIDNTLITSENIRSWRNKIGYIPQSIYLFDGTVAENITIGSTYDEEKIKSVLQMANIWDFLETKEGINTKVGEGGIQLSGGQQQRIGIARALYDNPEVLVLDEATSALDTETESKIMDEIYTVSRNKTLIVIAHRLSTVERCDRKIRIENGAMYE